MESPATAGSIRKQHITEYGQVIQSIFGDIFADKVDAVVNGEANGTIVLGGLEILRRGGTEIQKQCTAWVKQNGKLDDVSKCAITTAGNLPAKHVIHSPGIMWYNGKREEERKLRDAVYHCLECAHKHQLKSISFPAMSVTPLHSYPRDKCAKNMLDAALEWAKFRGMDTPISCIQFVSTDDEWHKELTREFDERFRGESDGTEISVQEEESITNEYQSETEEEEEIYEEKNAATSLLVQKVKAKITSTRDKRGVKRVGEKTFEKIRKSRRTSIDQDAMQMTQNPDAMQMTQNADAMQMTQGMGDDMMAISGASLAVEGSNDVDLSLSDHDLFL